jgi:hypothetical protein
MPCSQTCRNVGTEGEATPATIREIAWGYCPRPSLTVDTHGARNRCSGADDEPDMDRVRVAGCDATNPNATNCVGALHHAIPEVSTPLDASNDAFCQWNLRAHEINSVDDSFQTRKQVDEHPPGLLRGCEASRLRVYFDGDGDFRNGSQRRQNASRVAFVPIREGFHGVLRRLTTLGMERTCLVAISAPRTSHPESVRT